MKKNILFTGLLASFLLVNLNLNSSNNIEEVYKPIRIKNKDYNGRSLTIYNYADYIDEILRYLIEHGKGLEVNTAGFKYGLGFAHPHPDILKRYKELGGEIITIGADGHKPEHIAYDFYKISAILKGCGFKNYTEFRKRKPIFRQLP